MKETPKYLNTLGYRIYQRRGKNRERYVISLRDAENQSGISAATLSRIERGAIPDLETFRKLCIWLETSADELLGLNRQHVEESKSGRQSVLGGD